MGFIGASSSAQTAPNQSDEPGTPILTTLCRLLGVLELLAGGLVFSGIAADPRFHVAGAIGVAAVSIFGALMLFGVGQVVSYLSRSAAAAERTATAAERTAKATESIQRRAPSPTESAI